MIRLTIVKRSKRVCITFPPPPLLADGAQSHPERSSNPSAIADLLWFPTGGGKTEAYLGLTAYTLAIRRLQGTIAGRTGIEGVAVIMRYTLHLLTLQQFQRVAALICTCEIIRRTESATLGSDPFPAGTLGRPAFDEPAASLWSEWSCRHDLATDYAGSLVCLVRNRRAQEASPC